MKAGKKLPIQLFSDSHSVPALHHCALLEQGGFAEAGLDPEKPPASWHEEDAFAQRHTVKGSAPRSGGDTRSFRPASSCSMPDRESAPRDPSSGRSSRILLPGEQANAPFAQVGRASLMGKLAANRGAVSDDGEHGELFTSV